jgi:hypothetical protein
VRILDTLASRGIQLYTSKYKHLDKEIIKRYEQGQSVYTIGKHFGLRHNTVDYRLKINGVEKRTRSEALVGKPKSAEHRATISHIRIEKGLAKGSRNPNWKGGISPEMENLRRSKEYRLWRIAVFDRDNYICQGCGYDRGGTLEAHHIMPRSKFPHLMFAINNGVTLCNDCHKKIHSSKWAEFDWGELLGNPNVKSRTISSRASSEEGSETMYPSRKA